MIVKGVDPKTQSTLIFYKIRNEVLMAYVSSGPTKDANSPTGLHTIVSKKKTGSEVTGSKR